MRREIVILTRSLPLHGMGGMEIVVWDLAKAFVRMGHPVRVITTSLPGQGGDLALDGVDIVSLPGTPTGRYSQAWWQESRRYFERHCMDTAAAVLSVSAAGFGLLPLKRRLPGVPFIMQAHGTSWGEAVSKWRSGRLKSMLGSLRNLWWLPKDMLAYRKFDAVVAVGQQVDADLKRAPIGWVLPENNVHLISNGIDARVFRPSHEARRLVRSRLCLKEDTPIVVSASRLHAQKGVKHVILAFSELLKIRADAVLLIAGDGPERSQLEAMCSEMGLQKSVLFLGALQRTQLAEVYQAGDVFAFFTERIEGLPLNVLEAISTGLNALISDHLRIFDSKAIVKINPKKSGAASQKLDLLLSEHKRSEKSYLPDEYSLAHAAQAYIRLMQNFNNK